MARDKSPLQIRLEYYPVKAFLEFLRVLPMAVSEPLCHGLLRLLLLFIPRRRQLMETNLALCFPEKSAHERHRIADQSILNLARGIALYPRIPDLCYRGIEDWITLEGFHHLNEALQKGKGAITFTAHYGFWEIMAIYVTRMYPTISMIVRPLDNPMLDTLTTAIRSAGGGQVIPHRRALKEGLTTLRNNGVLGILIDQNFYKGGVFVDFFGRPAATTSVMSLFARRTGCAILPMHNVWEGRKIRIICEPPITLSAHPDPEQAVAEDTQLMTKYVEKWVRQDPTQWLWLHNRWKRKPEAGEPIYSPKTTPAVL